MTKPSYAALVYGLGLFATGAFATPINYGFNGSAGGDTQNAAAQFTISNCNMSGCQLDIVLTNDISSPHDAANGIIGLSFNIGNLVAPGTLNPTVTNGTGGAVSLITLPSGASAGSTNTLNEWTFGYGGHNAGCTASGSFCLDGHSLSHNPTEMIIGAGATGGNASVGNFNNWVAGPVDFEIDHFAGLTSNSTFSSVQMFFGTGPDGSVAGIPSNTTSATPEPFSFALVGSGLLALGMFRKRGARR